MSPTTPTIVRTAKRDRELLADRIAIGEVLARKRSAHDRHARRLERIVRADIASLQDRRADRFEESRRDKANARVARVAKVGSHESPGLFGSGTVVRIDQMPPRIVMGRKLM